MHGLDIGLELTFFLGGGIPRIGVFEISNGYTWLLVYI